MNKFPFHTERDDLEGLQLEVGAELRSRALDCGAAVLAALPLFTMNDEAAYI
jgi:hypothetical protein